MSFTYWMLTTSGGWAGAPVAGAVVVSDIRVSVASRARRVARPAGDRQRREPRRGQRRSTRPAGGQGRQTSVSGAAAVGSQCNQVPFVTLCPVIDRMKPQ